MRVLIYVALFGMAVVQTGPPAASQVGDGIIQVTVRDAITRAPVPGARITFIKQESPPPNIVTYINADENGRAAFKNLVFGSYTVNAQHAGYIQPPLVGMPPRVIGPDSRTHDVEIVLTKGTTISGRVRDANGEPVAEARVSLMTLQYREGRRTMALAASSAGLGSTDDRGEFRFGSAPPGDYYIQVEIRPGVGDYEGFWDNFPMRTYYPGVVDPRAATAVTVRQSQDLSGLDIRIPATQAFRIKGTVVNPFAGGRAMPNGETYRQVSSFFLASSDPESFEDPILLFSRQMPSPSPDETLFEIPSVAPGSYYLYPYWDPGGATTAYGGYTRRTLVQIGNHDVEDLRIVLKANNEVKGRLRVEGAAQDADWSITRIGGRRRERMPSLLGGGGLGTNTTVAMNGEFTLTNVPDVRFNLTVSGPTPDAYVVDVRQAGRSVFDEGIVPGSGEPLDVIVNLQGITLQGTVRDSGGMPAPRAGVVLVPSSARRSNTQLYKRVTADANGQFTFRGIAPGEYKAFAFSALPPATAEENAQFLEPYESRGTAVNTGSASNLQLLVIPLR